MANSDFEIAIDNLKCCICLNLYEDSHLLPCRSKCIACYRCIETMFQSIPTSNDEVEVLKKCIWNDEDIIINITPCHIISRLVKNVIVSCNNHSNGDPLFISKEMNERDDSYLDGHENICRCVQINTISWNIFPFHNF